MDYDELVAKVIELLQREKRVPYRALKRRFDLDDEYIEDLKMDLILKCCSKLSLLFIRLCKISTNGIMWPEKPGVIDDAK